MKRLENMIAEKKKGAQAGEIITTEVAIAEYLGVSRPTARKYIDNYARDGRIVRVPGKGIAIADKVLKPENRKPRNYMIMVSSFDFEDGFFSEIVKGITDVLNERGDQYRIFMSVKYEERLEFVQGMDLSEFDGAFISVYEDENSYGIIEHLQKNDLDVILVDNQLYNQSLDCVKNDDLNGGILLGEYLGKKGSEVAFVLPKARAKSTSSAYNGCQLDCSTNDRIRGVQWGLKKYGKKIEEANFVSLLDDLEPVLKRCNAFICYDSTTVLLTIQKLSEIDKAKCKAADICTFGNALLNIKLYKVACIKFDGYGIGVAAAKAADNITSSSKTVENIAVKLVTIGE